MSDLITVYRARHDALEQFALTAQPMIMAMPLDLSDGFKLTSHEARELRDAWQAVVASPHVAPQPRLFADTEAA
jgi:hypothetical protein